MRPALSVILFSTLSGVGYGIWFWVGTGIALHGWGYVFERSLFSIGVLTGALLSTAGLVASLWHLGKPLRTWRAFSQWRTSWLSREGIAALATLAIAALLLLLLMDGLRPWAGRLLAAALAICSQLTVLCTAMIYASLKPIPAWRHRLVVPGFIGFSLLTGALVAIPLRSPMACSLLATWDPEYGCGQTLLICSVLVVAMAVLKIRYWHAIDRQPLPHDRAAAVGLPARAVTVFERPHTESSFITREMAFVVARRHARLLRIASVLLFAAVPLLLLLAMQLQMAIPLIAGPLAAGSAWAGSFLERWLFFAQARHVVTLYY